MWLARNVLGQCRAVKIIYRNRFIDPRPFEREFEGIQRFEPISRSHPSQLAILHVGKNNVEDCFYTAIEAVNIARKYNVPVFVLSDQAIATRIEAFEEPDLERELAWVAAHHEQARLAGRERDAQIFAEPPARHRALSRRRACFVANAWPVCFRNTSSRVGSSGAIL